jgi:uncharacterized protein YjbI with pentapeptide repeats
VGRHELRWINVPAEGRAQSGFVDALTEPERRVADEPRPVEPLSSTAPTLAAKADDLEALRAAVIDAAGVSFGLWVSYLFVLFYLLVAADGVTHRDLFFESPVRLPFLNVDLPLKGFFWLGPALFLIVHTYVLLHFVMLAGKVGVFDAQLPAQIQDPEVRTRLRRQLPSNIFVQFLAGPPEVRDGIIGFLLWLIALISLVIGPIVLLVFFQLQFLPYHDEWITWWQRIAVMIDLALLWTLWPRIGLPKEVAAETGEGRRPSLVEATRRIGTIVAMLLLSIISLALVFTIATFPSEWLEAELKSLPPIAPLRKVLVAGDIDSNARRPKSLWSDRLVLPGLDVIDHMKFDNEVKIAALPVTASLRARHLENAVLIGAELRKADFAGSYLNGANLDEADLRSANLNDTEIRGASLRYAHFQDASLYEAQLQGADLTGAQLQGAFLQLAKLQGAFLFWAQLQGANLDGAVLRGARLENAKLQGARLYQTVLEGANLIGAELQGARLDHARLQGANLIRAQFQGASLADAKPQGALFDDAQLQGALLDRAELQGASLNGAQLRSASFRAAFVWRADARAADTTDARINSIESGPKSSYPGIWSAESFDSLQELLRKVVPEPLRGFALDRIKILNPETPLSEEKETAEYWDKLQSLSPAPAIYEAKLAEQWRLIGCSIDGAPYVLAGLVRTLASPDSPFSRDSVEVPRLATNFLKDDCAGAHGLSDDARARLKALRDRAARGAINPSSQTQ